MKPNVLRKVRRTVAGEWLKSKKRKINAKYYGLLPNEKRTIRIAEQMRKKRKARSELAREEIRIKEHKIPVIEKELQKLLDYKQLLLVFSKRKLLGISAETIRTEILLTNSEITQTQKRLKEVKAQLNQERQKAKEIAEKIGGKK